MRVDQQQSRYIGNPWAGLCSQISWVSALQIHWEPKAGLCSQHWGTLVMWLCAEPISPKVPQDFQGRMPLVGGMWAALLSGTEQQNSPIHGSTWAFFPFIGCSISFLELGDCLIIGATVGVTGNWSPRGCVSWLGPSSGFCSTTTQIGREVPGC